MDMGSGIRNPEKTYSGSRIKGSKRHRIPDPDPQHCQYRTVQVPVHSQKKYLIPNENLPFHVLELGMIVHNMRGQIRHRDAAQGAGLHRGVHHRIILYKIYRSQTGTFLVHIGSEFLMVFAEPEPEP